MAEAEELDLGEEGKGSKKKLIIIIVLALVLLGGGGGAAWFFLMGDEPPPEGEAAAQAKAEEEEEPVDESAPPIYHQFKPVFIAELPPGGKKKMLQIELQVLTHQPKVDAFLTTNDPMLRHHLLNLLSEQDGEALTSSKGREKLREVIVQRIGKLMKENGQRGEIDNVYFTQFVLQ
ncbi:MAG TPA: flagellar basal body-associated FliL family protein [Planctomycetaceae bacterium]|nr:flagellar basal body-associated FliL family protein [Planctomycetaceae bacterium]